MILLTLPYETPDADILDALQKGHKWAVDAAYQSYFEPLYQYTRFKVGDAALSEDIVADVFVQLLRVMGTPAVPARHLRGWLFTVTRNQTAAHHSQTRRITIDFSEQSNKKITIATQS